MPNHTRSSGHGSADIGIPLPNGSHAQRGVFRKEGEYWAIAIGGKAVRLKDSKGLGYLGYLLGHPGDEIHVLDLVGGTATGTEQTKRLIPSEHELDKTGMHIGNLGDAGELLDDQAKIAYRRRFSELREELEEAKALGRAERAEQIEQEMEVLNTELSRAVGLGGRNRRAASAPERARQTVTKTIKAVVERIAQADAALGDVFATCIKTGTFCSYRPDPNLPIRWEFFAASEESPAAQTPGDRVSVGAESTQAAAPVMGVAPLAFAERTPFVGRENESDAIRATIDRAQHGSGSVVLLGGGPGVGKTRLAMEMAEYAAGRGVACFVGRCYERNEPFPYLPFVEILESNLAQAQSREDFRALLGDNAAELAQVAPSLRRAFPDISRPPELPPSQQRHYLFQSVAEVVARTARSRPHLFVLDDLHWADDATLALLVYLTGHLARIPVVIIGTYRDQSLDRNPALAGTLEELIRMGIRPVKLQGLSEKDVAQVMRNLSSHDPPARLVKVIFEETQGNPFFIEEVFRHLAEEGKLFDESGAFRPDFSVQDIDVPDSVRLVLGRRLERLNDKGREVLTVAAVIGRGLSFELLQTVLKSFEIEELLAALEQAQRMGLIVENAESLLNFPHELIRQTLLSRISSPRQQHLHLQIAEAIERLWPETVNEKASELADHLLKAGPLADAAKTAEYFSLAGRNALERAAFEEAFRSFETAASYKKSDLRWRAQCLQAMQKAKRGLGDWEEALHYCNEGIEIYRRLGDSEMTSNLFFEAVEALVLTGRHNEAAEMAQRGLASGNNEATASRAELLAVLGWIYGQGGNYSPGRHAFDEAVRLAEQLSDQKLLARVLTYRAVFNSHFFEISDGLENSRRSLNAAQADLWTRALARCIEMLALHQLGRSEEAESVRSKLEPLVRRISQLGTLSYCIWIKAWTEFAKAPDPVRLDAQLSESLELDRKAGMRLILAVSLPQVSLAKFFSGQHSVALQFANESCGLEVAEAYRGFGIGAAFRERAYGGDRMGAIALLDRMEERLPRISQRNTSGSWAFLVSAIEGLAILGEHDRAGQLYPLARDLIDTGMIRFFRIARFPQTIAGVAAASARQWDAAEAHFHIALRQAEALPQQLERTECLRFYGSMLLERNRAGDRDEARRMLNQALQDYSNIGMPLHADLTKALLDRAAT